MNRRVPVLPLRGSDSTLLEVQLPDLLRRPLGQIAVVNVMDLIALAESSLAPRSTERGLASFVEGLSRLLADIPKGRHWEQFLDDLAELSGKAVPHSFRAMLAAEGEAADRAPLKVKAILERWAAEEPEPFQLAAKMTRIQRAEMVQPRVPSSEASSAPRERGEGRTPRAPKAPAAPKPPKPVADVERRDFVIDQALERLARTSDKGLGEAVLVAGIRHAARESYPDMTPIEVTTVLKSLKETNRVRYSAGRWALVTRF